MADPAECVEFEMMLLGRHMAFVADKLHDASPRMERSAYTILSRMDISGPMSIGELSEAFGLDASTVNRQTAALLRAGVAERIPDPEGGIARKFRLTAKGQQRLREAREANLESLGRIFRDWSREDVATFAAMLKRYNMDIERIGARPWPRP